MICLVKRPCYQENVRSGAGPTLRPDSRGSSARVSKGSSRPTTSNSELYYPFRRENVKGVTRWGSARGDRNTPVEQVMSL